jgi:DNA-directed RNA polymerase subunit beta
MLTIKSDDVYGRSKAYESIIKKTEIVGPKVPESFNVLVKELQGLGLKVDLVHQSEVIDAEAILATNIHEEAVHPSNITVPTPTISDIDVSDEETIENDMLIEEADDDDAELAAAENDNMEIEDVALVVADDDTENKEEEA